MEIIDGNRAQADDEAIEEEEEADKAVEEEEEADETHPAQGPQIGVAGGEREEREGVRGWWGRKRKKEKVWYVGGGEKKKKKRGTGKEGEREKKLRKESILEVVKKINILKNGIVKLK